VTDHITELMEHLNRNIGLLEIDAARRGLDKPQEEKDLIWEQMLRATKPMRESREEFIRLSALAEASEGKVEIIFVSDKVMKQT